MKHIKFKANCEIFALILITNIYIFLNRAKQVNCYTNSYSSLNLNENTKFKIFESLASHIRKGKIAFNPLVGQIAAKSMRDKLTYSPKNNKENSYVIGKNKHDSLNSNVKQIVNNNKNLTTTGSIGDGPIYYKGWIKFVKHYYDKGDKSKIQTKVTKPAAFYKNNKFFKQLKYYNKKLDLETQDSDQTYKYIKSEEYFYAKLLVNQLSILSSKEVNYTL